MQLKSTATALGLSLLAMTGIARAEGELQIYIGATTPART